MNNIKTLIQTARGNNPQTAEFKRGNKTYYARIMASGRFTVSVDGRRVSAQTAQDELNKQNNATYKHRGENYCVKLTEKCNGISEISVKGVRWYDNIPNCYHKIYVSALVNGRWVELGGYADMRAGFDSHYLVTAGEWLIENGYIDAPDDAVLCDWVVREAFNITHYAQDVKRKKDM